MSETRTPKAGDSASISGDKDRGIVYAAEGPIVSILFEFTGEDGTQRSEYYRFKSSGLTWNENTGAWDIGRDSVIL